MITFTQGNLLEARAEALVNTVNTVGVMGKGIALMFKERFADNFRLYAAACKAKEVQTGSRCMSSMGRDGSSTSPPSSTGARLRAWSGWSRVCRACGDF